MSDLNKLGDALMQLSLRIVQRVNADRVVDNDAPPDETGARAVKLSEQIDSLKAASAFYIARLKVKSKEKPQDDESGFSFSKSRDKLRAIDGGKD